MSEVKSTSKDSIRVKDIPEAKIIGETVKSVPEDTSTTTDAKKDSSKDSDTSETGTTKNSSRIFDEVELPSMKPVVRFIVVAILVLAGAYFLLGAFVVSLATIALIPAFFNGLLSIPIKTMVVLITYLCSCFAYGALGVLSPMFAYRIFRKKSIKRSLIILGVIALVLVIINQFILLPIITNFLQS